MNEKKRLSEKVDEYYDWATFHLSTSADFLAEKISDFFWDVIQLFAWIIGKFLVGFVELTVPGPKRRKNPVLSFVNKTIAVFIVLITWCVMQIFVSTVGVIANLFGFRQGKIYEWKENFVSWIPLGAIAISIPFLNVGDFWLMQLILFFSYSVILLGLNIALGITGQAVLGHGALVLSGGYATAMFYSGTFFDTQIPALPSIFLGGVFASVVGLLIGLPGVRLKGPYLALLTLGLMTSMMPIAKSQYFFGLTHGMDGLSFSSPNPPLFLNFIDKGNWMYLLALIVFACAFYSAHIILRRTKMGIAWMAIREGDDQCNVLGINVWLYKILSFSISAFYAGIGGGLLTLNIGNIFPNSITLKESLEYLVALVVGGIGTNFGAVIGAVFLTYQSDLTAWLSTKVTNGDKLLWGVYGIILIFAMIVAPKGIVGEIRERIYQNRFGLPLRRFHRRVPYPEYDFNEEAIAIGEIKSTEPDHPSPGDSFPN